MCAALSWTGTLIVARQLGTLDYGSFAFVFNLLGLLGLLADFETTRVVMAELGRGGDEALSHVAGRFIVFRVALGTVTYVLALVIVLVGPYSHSEVIGVAIGGLSFFVASASWSLISICQAKQWLRTVAVALVAGGVVQFVCILGIHFSGHATMVRYIVPYVLSDAVVLVWIAVALRGTVSLRPRLDVAAWRRWFVDATPLAIGSALGTLYFRIDGVMITLVLHGDASRVALALYQTGYKFSDLLAFLAPALIAASLPLFAAAWPDDHERFRRIFRQTFVMDAPSSYTNLSGSLLRDDGAVVYLNGTEVFRSNMPGGTITYATLASSDVTKTLETTFYPFSVSPSLLVAGTNLLAVEVHQFAANSPDLSFDLSLEGTRFGAPVIVSQPQNQDLAAGATAQFSVVAVGATPLRYQWFLNGLTPLGGATNATLSIPNVQAANGGSYSVQVSNAVGSVRSAEAVLTLKAPPLITTQPASQTVPDFGNASFTVSATGDGLTYQIGRAHV